MLLYIHIPFCDSKCAYCAFNSYVDKFHLKAHYMEALHTQLLFELKRFTAKRGSIESVFIGGGTPSTIPPKLYEKVFASLDPYLKKDAEITTEANPNSATKEWLLGMKMLGVNRVSFGVQSFDDAKLKLLNRAHSAKQAIQAVCNAHNLGITNLSLDLIYGVAGDTQTLLLKDIQSAFSLPINHLSAYALTIEDATPFAQKPHIAHEHLETTRWLFEQIKNRGFTQYEISNFGTYRSKHNLGYWHYKDYMGVGAGAVGKLGDVRLYPHKEIERYIADPLQTATEQLSPEDQITEKLFLGFRSVAGVAKSLLTQAQQSRCELLVAEGKLTRTQTHCYNKDYLLADEVSLFVEGY